MSPTARPLRERWRAVPWLLTRAPRWARAVLGVALLALGLFLVVRPLTAVSVLGLFVGLSAMVSGVADLLDRGSGRWSWLGARCGSSVACS